MRILGPPLRVGRAQRARAYSGAGGYVPCCSCGVKPRRYVNQPTSRPAAAQAVHSPQCAVAVARGIVRDRGHQLPAAPPAPRPHLTADAAAFLFAAAWSTRTPFPGNPPSPHRSRFHPRAYETTQQRGTDTDPSVPDPTARASLCVDCVLHRQH